MVSVDLLQSNVDTLTHTEESTYPLIQEKYFKGEPTDMVIFQNLIHLVPEVVGQLGHLFDGPREKRARMMNRLYHLGLLELVTICTAVVVDDFASLKMYTRKRLASILLVEVDML